MSTLSVRFEPKIAGYYAAGGLTDVIATGQDLASLVKVYTQPDGETWQHVLVAISLAAGANLDIDLVDPANTVEDRAGRPLNLSRLYAVALAVTSPNGTKALRLGPQDVVGGCQLWFGGKGATSYEEVDRCVVRVSEAGWAVSAGDDKVRVNNPTGATVTGSLYLVGKQ